MDVYLIRHAESEDNVFETTTRAISRARYNVWLKNNPHSILTPRGQEQALALADQLRDVRLDRLYTSPWQRAHATAEVLGAALGLTPVSHPELHEVLPPPLPERGGPASMRRHFVHSYLRMCLPGARPESWPESVRRVRGAWRELTSQPVEAIAVVSHGWVIALLCLMLANSREWHVMSRDLRNCGVSLITSRRKPLRLPPSLLRGGEGRRNAHATHTPDSKTPKNAERELPTEVPTRRIQSAHDHSSARDDEHTSSASQRPGSCWSLGSGPGSC